MQGVRWIVAKSSTCGGWEDAMCDGAAAEVEERRTKNEERKRGAKQCVPETLSVGGWIRAWSIPNHSEPKAFSKVKGQPSTWEESESGDASKAAKMKWLNAAYLFLLGVDTAYATAKPQRRDYDKYDYYAVHLPSGVDPRNVSSHLGLHYDGPLGELADHYILRAASRQLEYDHIQSAIADLKWRRRKREPGSSEPHVLDNVLLSRKQELHKRFPLVKRDVPPAIMPRYASGLLDWRDDDSPSMEEAVAMGKEIAANLSISDPIFQEQWHLFNHVQIGHDLNVSGVWAQNITGKGSYSCIVDDGLDLDSDDLKDNYFAGGSYDFNDQVEDPKPRLSDDKHGTRCAGEIAAVRNDVCGVGVAYDSKVSGVRILSKVISNADEAVALNYAYQENQIYSCSWGPPDDGQSMEVPDVLIRRAMVNGVQKGRGGLGSIYVFALGNGAAADDNCNFDGYTNSIYSVSVGGIDRKGLHPYYSEKCSAALVVTYSSGSGDAIHTTDVGKDKCYSNHGGTSAAGPLVAGIYALMLEANPKLGWRDFQHITARTAVKVDQPSDWVMNKAIGKEYSHQYGYGKADAYAMVEAAKTWKNVKAQSWFYSPWLHVKHKIPQGDKGLASTFEVTKEMLDRANFERIEHVVVTMNVKHTRRGDLSVELKSPSGMVSHIATHRRNDAANAGYVDWDFMSVAHWGEEAIGTWTVIVKDTNVNDHSGTFTDWRLKLFGESIDESRATLLPLPTEHDDDDHDLVQTQTASVGTTTVAVPTDVAGQPPGNPDDHQHRPVRPTKIESVDATPTPNPSDNPSAEEDPPSDLPSNFLPRPFPTFGASKRTQIWIYGAITLILIFLAALGGWWYQQRRKRRWMNRENYDFELVEHEDLDDERRGVNGAGGGGGRRKKRAGELYDAFAEASEGEDEVFDLGSDSDRDEDEDVEEAGRRKEGRGRYVDDEGA